MFRSLAKNWIEQTGNFFSALDTLKSMTLAPIQITVKAKTADIEQDQRVQTNNSHE